MKIQNRNAHHINIIFPYLTYIKLAIYFNVQNNYKIHVFQLSYVRITFKITHHDTNLPDHQNRCLGRRYGKPMMTVKYGIDRCQCFRLVITNTTDNSLYRKTAVFVLRIIKKQKLTIWLKCKHVECSVRIITTVPYTDNNLTRYLVSPATLPHLHIPQSVPCRSRSDLHYSSA